MQKMTYDASPTKMVINFLSNFVGKIILGEINTDHGDGGQNALRTMIEMPAWYPVKNY